MNGTTQPTAGLDPGLVTYTNVIYGLHALSVLIGITGPATVVGNFVFGLPSIIAVIMNYARQSEARGTWLESHFRWQIRTFWFTLLWFAVGGLTFFIVIGWFILCANALWFIYRIAKGWLNLIDDKPMPV